MQSRTGGRVGTGFVVRDLRYRNVASVLAEEISSGSLGDDSHLPSERVLSLRFGVSRVTIRHALHELEMSGLVLSSPGRGWLVRGGRFEEPENELLSFTAIAGTRGLRAGARLILIAVRDATLEESDQLHVAPGARVVELDRLRLLDGVPIALDRSLVPETLPLDLPAQDWTSASLYAVMAAAGCAPVRADYVVRADGADPDEARLLGLAGPGAPVLRADQVSYDAAGHPVQVCRLAYRGDRYRFHASLARRG